MRTISGVSNSKKFKLEKKKKKEKERSRKWRSCAYKYIRIH